MLESIHNFLTVDQWATTTQLLGPTNPPPWREIHWQMWQEDEPGLPVISEKILVVYQGAYAKNGRQLPPP